MTAPFGRATGVAALDGVVPVAWLSTRREQKKSLQKYGTSDKNVTKSKKRK